MNIKVSHATFFELADAMKKAGREIAQGVNAITFEKSDRVDSPVDYMFAKMKKDCLVEATKICIENGEDVVELADRMFKFITGEEDKLSETTAEEWK